MRIKTSELTGAALDWAVAKCDGHDMEYFQVVDAYLPSTDWAQGGPIIEREDISFRKYHRPDSEAHGKYYARVCRESGTLVGWHKTTGFQQTGPTPLIAAMRCYVTSKLGDDIDIPEELTP
tara:strand:+ start:561 stop:923 length:363 start_codon:yes stop_codon:yes gene_type:complete